MGVAADCVPDGGRAGPTRASLAQQLAYLAHSRDCSTSYAHTDPYASTCALSIPWCNRQLRWQLLFSPQLSGSAPDVVFDDASFQPLCSPPPGGQPAPARRLRAVIESWHERRLGLLLELVEALLDCYQAHNLARLAVVARTASRLQFELDTLDMMRPGLQVELQQPDGPGAAARACFTVPVGPIQVTQLRDLAALYAGRSTSSSTTTATAVDTATSDAHEPNTPAPHEAHGPPGAGSIPSAAAAAAAAAAGGGGGGSLVMFKLHAVFRVAAGTDHSEPPELALQAPPDLLAQQPGSGVQQQQVPLAPPLLLPLWGSHDCLAEFVPMAAERLQQQVDAHCTLLANRRELLLHVGELFGAPPLEVNLAGGTAAYSVLWEGSLLVVSLELGPRFPADKPAVTLHCARQLSAPDAQRTYRDVPWSPRWAVREMAARLFNWIREELPNFMRGRLPPATAGV